jgi:hypothetical protein
MSQQQELMLIFGAAGIMMEDVPGQHRVMQRISPRVIIIEPASTTTKEELQNKKIYKQCLIRARPSVRTFAKRLLLLRFL